MGEMTRPPWHSFWKALLIALAVQLVLYVFYWFGPDNVGGGTAIQIVFYDVYWPFFLLFFLVEEAMGVHRRGSIYFLMLFAPLIGAFTYSVAIAFVVLLFRKLSIRRGDG